MKVTYDHHPDILESIGDGRWRYNYDIRQSQSQDPLDPYTQWETEQVIINATPTSNLITQAVIADRWPSDHEAKLVNEYNAAALGLYGAATSAEAKAKKQAYKEFLEERARLKEQVDGDCQALGIH